MTFAETALHVAVKNKHFNIVSALLSSGANPNIRMYLPDDEMLKLSDDDYVFTGKHSLIFFFISYFIIWVSYISSLAGHR